MRKSGRPTGRRRAAQVGAWILVGLFAAACGSARLSPTDTDEPRIAVAALQRPSDTSPAPAPLAATATATEVPRGPSLHQLTSDGCCVHPFWLPDSEWIAFIDRREPDASAGIYAIPIDGGAPTLVVRPVGVLSQSWSHLAYLQGGRTLVRSLADDTVWTVPNQGRAVWLSPSGSFAAWLTGSRGITHPDLRERVIWVAETGGTSAEELVRVRGGGLVGWVGDESHVIVTGQLGADGPAGLWRIEPEGDRAVLLAEAQRPRDPLISPGGAWLAFYVAFDSGPLENGLWVVRTDGSQLARIELFGAYRWRGEGLLLVIPMESEGPGASLWEIDAATGEAERLTNPWRNPLHVRGNDWQVSPDGEKIVYVSSTDGNIWLLELGPP